ncbi:MAG: phosphoglycerate kinase [Candidatus Saccharibacteria bacterium]|nr:phosphoglycerate kinase [Candidatus Saccharibacteria bacterium]
MFTKKTVHDIDVKNKTIVLRAMLNVPIKDGKVGDKMRLKAALPTINYLISQSAKIILISHHSHEGQSLEPVAGALSELVGRPVAFASDCIGEVALAAVKALPSGGLLMLENLRFHPEEEANDEEFARTLASYGDIYVNDDFTTCHRSHASLVGIPKFIPAVAGLEVEEEVNTITSSIDNPKRPLVAIAGGAKISTKVPIISFLLDKVDVLFVGGAMANTFLLAKGLEVGNSLVELDQVETAKQIIKSAEEKGKTLLLPIDVVVTTDVKEALNVRVLLAGDVGIDDIIADLGPMSVLQLNEVIKPEGSVIWNGPIGIAEQKEFANGTEMVAEEIISSGAFSIVGGGDTADYVDGAGLADKFGFVSTGGGASLELMSGNILPGIAALLDK